MKLRKIYIVFCLSAMIGMFIILKLNGYELNFIFKSEAITAVLSVAFFIVYEKSVEKALIDKINRLKPILNEERNPDKYILESEKLLDEVKTENERAIVLINISNAYCDKHEYKTAAEKLMEIDCDRLSDNYEVMCSLYRAYVFFYLGDYASTLYIMTKYERKFNKLRNNIELEPFIAVLNIFRFIAEGNLEKANEVLFIAEQRWDADGENWDLKHLKRLINKPKREF